MTIVDDYLKYTKKWKKTYGEQTLVLMQCGSFFECYAILEKNGIYSGSNIQDFSDINDMTISKKNVYIDQKQVVMAGFGLPQLEKYIKKLQEHGYTIVVYTQDSPSKNPTRSLSCIFSPGTYFSNDSQELSNNTMCIWIHYSKANKLVNELLCIGLANIDIYTGKTSVYEFTNEFLHNPCTYDELEKYIAIYKPNECIIISNLEESYIDSIIKFTNINSIKIHKIVLNESSRLNESNKSNKSSDLIVAAINSEKQVYQAEIIKQFYNKAEEIIIQDLNKYCIATQAFCFLLDFIYKHNPYLVNKIYEPIFENHKNKLILANHSLKQLNIISDTRQNGKLASVCEFLNNCITTIGKRRFNYDLLNPICNIDILNNSYKITEHLIKKSNYWEHFRNILINIRDIEKIKRKLIMGKITPKDFFYLYDNLSTIQELNQFIKKDKAIFNYINSLIYNKKQIVSDEKNKKDNIDNSCKNICAFIKKYFDLEKCKNIDDITLDKLSNLNTDQIDIINRNINNELDIKLKNCMDSREKLECIRLYFSDLLKTYEKTSKSNDFVKIHETPKMDAMLIGTKRRITILKNEIEKIIKKDGAYVTLSYISKYTNNKESLILDITLLEFKVHGGNMSNLIITGSEIREIANNIQISKDILINNIIKLYHKILQDFIVLQEDENTNLHNIIQYITYVDILQCKCYIATKYNYNKPTIDIKAKKSFVEIEKLRHCLIEQLNDKELYVSNDLCLGKDINGILLYGTNAVGKTSLIKSIGIALIMAQAGLFVPASKFNFSPYNYLFTRILGNDNIFKGLSTFAVEMSELRTILKQSDKNSLILGDELCSGTESTSALSIFVSGLERLYKLDSTFIFATHFHEIVNYEEIKLLDKLKLCHMSVIYNREIKKLIYDRKLKNGPGESMYGLEVCKALDLPDDFLNRAHELRSKYNKENSNILSMKSSRYNSKKIKGLCEICKINKGEEVHHLQFQNRAVNNYIDNEFHKNHIANLINICGSCHDKIHKEDLQHKVVKTSEGYEICSI